MEKVKISKDPKLNDIIFRWGKETPVLDPKGKELPNIIKRTFKLSVPYCIGEGIVALPRTGFLFGGRDSFYSWPKMTSDVAEKLTKRYVEIHAERLTKVFVEEVNPAIYNKPQPALKGYPLNAFEAKGVAYSLKKTIEELLEENFSI